MRLRRRGGFAALVDSLCFLAVASVVSLSIAASVSLPSEDTQDWSDYVSRSHQALLLCQVQIETEGASLPRMEISSLATMVALSDNSSALLGPLSDVSSRLLERFIPSSMSYQWTLVSGDATCRVCGELVCEANEVYSSWMSLSSGDGIASRLAMWPSLGGELNLA
jgi:hypothetical protein